MTKINIDGKKVKIENVENGNNIIIDIKIIDGIRYGNDFYFEINNTINGINLFDHIENNLFDHIEKFKTENVKFKSAYAVSETLIFEIEENRNEKMIKNLVKTFCKEYVKLRF